jgi:hypothetical protein
MPGSWDGKSRPSNDSYRRNFDEIFAKEKELTDISMKQSIANKRERQQKKSCPCGRSPVGICIGWHSLSKERYQEELKKWNDKTEKEKQAIYHPKAIDGLGD